MQNRRATLGVIALCLVGVPASAEMAIDRRKSGNEVMVAPPPPPAAAPRRDAPVVEEQPPRDSRESEAGQLVQEDPRCQQWANRAADQFRLANSHPGCAVAEDDRWNPDVRRHYRWCLRANDERRDAEQSIRDAHLFACGAQRR